jgi:Beta propeller domain
MPRLAAALALLALALAPAASLAAEGDADAAAKKRQRLAKQLRLKAFGSCTGLVRYGRRHARQGPGALEPPAADLPAPLIGAPPPTPAPGVPEPLPAPVPIRRDAAETGSEDSGTNVQELGVDEPDLVKAGGGHIFVVAGERLHAVDAGGLGLLGSLPLEGFGHQLLLDGERLLVISQTGALDSDGGRILPSYGDEVTQLTEVDVSSPAAMRVLRTERIRGRHVSSRLTGHSARVVIWTRPRAVVEPRFRTQLRGWLPRRVLRKATGGRPRFRLAARCRRVLRPALHSGIDMLSVLTIDMEKGLPAADSDAVMAGGQTVYASPKSLYVATPKWSAEDGMLLGERTQIHKFAATGASSTSYRASGQVEGQLLNQFSLSEYDDVLRAATTVGIAPESESRVTTLAERGGILEPLGQVGGLGKGERIYALRFIGDTGYVVTFRQVDPLYTLDLSEPARPRVVGELKIRGYSAYLHPLAADLLLGIGQDASERGTTLGTQVSLFDVSDPARPSRLHQWALAGGGSSEAEWDHHAFLWWAPSRLAVLPLESWGRERFAGAVGLKVERAAGIAEAGRASHVRNGEQWPVRRSLVVGGRLVTISDVGIERNNLASMAEEAWLAFP